MVDAGNLGSVHPNMTAVLCAESASVLGEVDMSFEIPEDERDRSSCLPLNNAPIAQNGCEQARTCWQLQSTIEELRVKNEEIEGLLATIRKDLDEKELLLREVYHRVKNNLQVVKSLLSMGARSVGDGDGRDAIKAAERRIQVIASAHQRLYQAPNLATLTLSAYISEIAEGVIAANADPTIPIQLKMEFDEIPLPLDLAIPLGLLVNELVTNCLKHGFSQDHAGAIWLSARIVPGAVHFVLHDNGKGLPENFNTSKSRSMGLRLAHGLAHQLGGQLAFSTNNGCRIEADLKRLWLQK